MSALAVGLVVVFVGATSQAATIVQIGSYGGSTSTFSAPTTIGNAIICTNHTNGASTVSDNASGGSNSYSSAIYYTGACNLQIYYSITTKSATVMTNSDNTTNEFICSEWQGITGLDVTAGGDIAVNTGTTTAVTAAAGGEPVIIKACSAGNGTTPSGYTTIDPNQGDVAYYKFTSGPGSFTGDITSDNNPTSWTMALFKTGCVAPTGVVGQTRYDVSSNILKYCDGSSWVWTTHSTLSSCVVGDTGKFKFSGGTYQFCNGTNWIDMKGSSITTCTAGNSGHLTFDSTLSKLKFCDGTNWYDASMPAPTGLVVAYGFTEGSGTATSDASGNNYVGYLQGGTQPPKWANGHTGSGLQYFVLKNSTVTTNTNIPSLNNFTLMAWVYTTALATTGQESVIVSKSCAANNCWSLAMENTNYNDTGFTGQPEGWVVIGGSYKTVKGSGTLPLNTWSHLALTFDGSSLIYYVNGLVNASAPAAGTPDENAGVIQIGNDTGPDGNNGSIIDDARVYSTALTQYQIKALMGTPVGAGIQFLKVTSQSIFTNVCSPVTVTTYDSLGNLTNPSSQADVTVSATGPVTLYANSNCTTAAGVSTIWSFSNSTVFYAKATAAGSITITASAAGYSSGKLTTTTALSTTSPFGWTGAGGNADWTTAANWRGGVVPGGNDVAVFDTTCSSNCSPTINASIYLGGIYLGAGYTGTITQNPGQTIGLNSQGIHMEGGTFNGGNGDISIYSDGTVVVNAGTFKATSANLVPYNFSSDTFTVAAGATFNANGGTVEYHGQGMTLGSPVTFNNLKLYNDSNLVISGTANVNGTLTIGTANQNSLTGGTINAKGNVNIENKGGYANTPLASATTIVVNGSSNQTINASAATLAWVPNLTIASTGGTVTMAGNLLVSGNYTYTSGTMSFGTSTMTFSSNGYLQTQTATFGTPTYKNIVVQSWGPSGDKLQVTGNLSLSGGLTIDATNGPTELAMTSSAYSLNITGALTLTGSTNGATLTKNGATLTKGSQVTSGTWVINP